MRLITLSNIPNQSFSVSVDNNFYDLTIKQIAGQNTYLNGVFVGATNVIMACSITRNNVLIEEGSRIIQGIGLMPYQYQEQGNFVLVTANDEYADYQQFGISQFLYYLSNSELAAIRAANLASLNQGI